MNDYATLLARLRHFVKEEADKQRLELERQWPLAPPPLAMRVARGFAIDGLRVADVHQGGLILLDCRANASRFREGELPGGIRKLLAKPGS